MNPTRAVAIEFQSAYDYFNERLFNNALPACLITMQRHSGAFGFFAAERFGAANNGAVADEIALNPKYLGERPIRESLATLVHEMTHLQQAHFGTPSRAGYHNKEWASLMRAVGLIPSDTGQQGGREVGQKVSHYIQAGGPFDVACAAFIAQGGSLTYADRWDEQKAKAKRSSKTKFSCPGCALNAWAKPGARLVCGECDQPMRAEEPDGED